VGILHALFADHFYGKEVGKIEKEVASKKTGKVLFDGMVGK